MSFDFPASVENQDDEALAFRAEIRMSDNVRVPVIACFLRRVAFVKVDWQRAFPKGDDFEFLGDKLTHNWRSCSLPLAPDNYPRLRWFTRDRSARMRQIRTPTGWAQRLRVFDLVKAEGL